LSLVQSIPLTGAIIVSTPQTIALADARKAISMFQMPSLNVPVLGMVENMAYFTPAELPDNKYYIFGKEGAKNLAEHLNIPVLGEIPLIQSIRESADVGRPSILIEGSVQATAFYKLAQNVAQQVAIANASKVSQVTE
jgi:ATP-binding protein involved in chromosome partitioning